VKRYATLDELRNAVEKKVGAKLGDAVWEEYQPFWDQPYDNGDIKEIVGNLRENNIKVEPEQRFIVQAYKIRSEIAAREMESNVRSDRQNLFSNPEPLLNDREEIAGWILEKSRNQESVNESSITTLDYPTTDGWVQQIAVYEGSFLHKLCKVVKVRARELDCQEAAVLEFILIGKEPIRWPTAYSYMRGSEGSDIGPYIGEITITIRGPVKDDEIVSLYRKLRKIVWGKERNRKSISVRNAELVKHVTNWARGISKEADPKTWDDMMRQWNMLFPNWTFDYWQGFRRAFITAFEQIYPNRKWKGLPCTSSEFLGQMWQFPKGGFNRS